jgi:hypothetical protein
MNFGKAPWKPKVPIVAKEEFRAETDFWKLEE